jgi:hypothetical protein
MISVLDKGIELLTPEIEDTLAIPRIKGLRIKHDLLRQEGGVISSRQVAEILGISRQAVDKRRLQGKLLAVSLGRRGYFYPLWQFGDKGVLEGFEEVMEILRDEDPWTIMIFFLSKNSMLKNKKPLDKLRQRHLNEVLRAAGAVVNQGAL